MEAMEIVNEEEALISLSPVEIYSGSDMNESDISISRGEREIKQDTNQSNTSSSSLKRKCDDDDDDDEEEEEEEEEEGDEDEDEESEEEEKPFVLISDCLDRSNKNFSSKLAAAIAAPCVVSVASVDMVHLSSPLGSQQDVVFWGSGIIIECQEDVLTRTFLTTIITVASLFKHSNNVDPSQIQVDVYVSKDNHVVYHAQMLSCDFLNNLAAIQIRTKFQLQTATLKALYDVYPIRPTQQLLPCSNLFKICPGTNIITLLRSSDHHNSLCTIPAVFEDNLYLGQECNELYQLTNHTEKAALCGGPVIVKRGGPVINYDGEVIGIVFDAYAFLPSNIVLKWWKHLKRSGQYCRPRLGIKVANLYSSSLKFLENFMVKFPDINTGVIVAKAAEDSPAYCSGIRPGDVIIECNGKVVCSKLELFDIIWDKVGENVDVTVLRASADGQKLNLSLTVGKTTLDNFYKWPPTSE